MKAVLLDTNVLVALSDPRHSLFQRVEAALQNGVSLMTCAVAWHEYMCGPLNPEDRRRVLLMLENRVLTLDRNDAEVAAMLFNRSGRRRGSKADCLIAAVALRRDLPLLTANLKDFDPFISCGVHLF